MDVEFELLVILVPAILFSIITVILESPKSRISFSLLAVLCWIGVAFGFVATNPAYPAFGMVFFGITSIFIYTAIDAALEMFRKGIDEEWWKE